MRATTMKQQEVFESVSEELEHIKATHGGLLEPIHVVEYAENPDTLLHRKFEWDDSKAANGYRLWQARKIISLELVAVNKAPETRKNLLLEIGNDGNELVRTYVSLTSSRFGEERGYRNIYDVISDEETRAQLLEDAKQDMLIFRRKYYLLKELSKVFETMEKV